MRLQVANSTTTVYYSVTNVAPTKPYLQISNQYLPLTTATLAGIKLKVESGTLTYRACTYQSGYYNTTSAAVGNLSSTTALTRASTSGTNYGTRASTSAATYATRASTSGTTYLTRASTSAATYATRASTSGTTYLTRTSASGYQTRSSASAYQTRSSISGYATRSSISGYATSASTVLTPITSSTWNNTTTLNSKMWITHMEIFSCTGNLGTAVYVRSSTGYPGQSAMTVSKYDFLNNGLSFVQFSGRNFTATRIYSSYYSRQWQHQLWTYKPNNATHYTSWTVSEIYATSLWSGSNMQKSYNGFRKTSPIQGIYLMTAGSKSSYSWCSTTASTAFGSTFTRWMNYTSSLSFTDSRTSVTNMYNGTSYVGPMSFTGYSYYLYDLVEVEFYSLKTVASNSSSTKVVTSATLTRASTSATLTRASTSATLTRASTSATLTRASTSGTNYGTRASTSAATYATRASTSGTNYGTRASTSAATYATRASTSGTTYLTRASTSAYSGKLSSSKWA